MQGSARREHIGAGSRRCGRIESRARCARAHQSKDMTRATRCSEAQQGKAQAQEGQGGRQEIALTARSASNIQLAPAWAFPPAGTPVWRAGREPLVIRV